METLDYQSQFDRMKKDATAALTKALDIESKETNRKIVVKEVWIDDSRDSSDFESQRQAVRKDQTWGVPVYAALDLVERTSGKTLSSTKRVRVATLPKSTNLGSFIVEGKHYQVQSQFRRKPGVYITEKKNRQPKAEINIAGRPFDIEQDPESGVFTLLRGPNSQSGIPLYPILSALGVADQTLARTWGSAVLDQNKAIDAKRATTAVRKAAEYFTRTKPGSIEEAAKAMHEFFEETNLNSDVTKDTVGREFKRVTPEVFVRASEELLKSERGERPVDDRQALQFKKVMSPADLLKERLVQESGELAAPLAEMRKRVFRRLSNRRKQPTEISQVVDTNEFSPVFTTFFAKSLANTIDQTNPINMLNGLSKITILGEGGVKDESKARAEERSVHPSHLGFVDPIHTPDSGRIGLVTNLPLGVVKSGDELRTRVRDVRKGGMRFISPREMKDLVVAFPDQYKKGEFVDDKVKALVSGEVRLVDRKRVDVVLASPKQAFSISSNSIPFLPAAQGVRAQMATKMLEQAIPLAAREAPLVQVTLGPGTLEGAVGKAFSFQALEDGTVEKVTPSHIVVRTKDGGLIEQTLYNNLPLNSKSFLHAEPRVKVGDPVTKGQVLADSNFTAGGTLAIGTNLKAAYIPYKGMTIEDGIVITESAAQKLASEHMHKFAFTKDKSTKLSLDEYMGWRPNDLSIEQQDKMDLDGIVKKGQIVKKGDALWVGSRENKYDPDTIAMRRFAPSWDPRRGYKETWNGDTDAEVVDVVRHGNTVKVFVRTLEPAVIGDKLTDRHGAKGIITQIIPDGEAPRTSDDEPVDILLNPHGVVSRINPSQILETAAAKVAAKTGKTYTVDNFSGENYTQSVMDALAKAGLQDTEPLFDPHSKDPLGNVLVGPKYILKLSKQATQQFSARAAGEGAYDLNQAPAGRGEEGAKGLDSMAFYSMLAHGSRANLREMATFKTSKNPEFWRWLASGGARSGLIKPPPEPSFAYRKFEAYMKGAGVNMERRGSTSDPKIMLGPMTNQQVDNLSAGGVQDAVFKRAKDLKDEPGGFTDPVIFGPTGDRWGHLDLSEPIPNPVFEDPIKRLTGLQDSQFNGLVRGDLFFNPETGEWGPSGGLTGGAALKHLLSQVDVDQQIRDWTDKAKEAMTQAQDPAKASSATRWTKLNDANKQLRYLHGLKKAKLRPEEAYIQDKIPIIPPQFRPIMALDDGTLSVSGLNNLYRDVTLINNELKWQKETPFLPEDVRADLRTNLYNGVKALIGRGTPIAPYTEARMPKGFITQIQGPQAKRGLFQRQILRREQEPVARGTIIPDPKLGMDEVGLPEEMAWKLFDKFVIRRLVTTAGKTPLAAAEEVTAKTQLARDALEVEMGDRPIWLNRPPSLHKFSMQSFRPRITDGKALKIPPLVIKGFNADFDGDTMTVHVPILPDAVKEAYKALPSRNLFNPGTGQIMVQPQNEAALGLFLMTSDPAKKQAVLDMIPESLRPKYEKRVLDKGGLRDLLHDLAATEGKDFAGTLDRLKSLGDRYTYQNGFTIGLKDLVPDVPGRQQVFDNTTAQVRKLDMDKPEQRQKAIQIISDGNKELDQAVKTGLDGQGNSLHLMVKSGARGNINQLKQIVSAPFMVEDYKGQPIPIPITRSFSEGLAFSDYWSTLYGARQVATDKQLQTQQPGAFTKDVMATTINNVISADDCGTKEGIQLPLNDKNADLDNRFLAGDIKVGGRLVASAGAPVTSGLLDYLRNHRISQVQVRSPLTCKRAEGTCAVCYGLHEDGQRPVLGDNVGAISGQALSEPLTQMTLRTFHSGGVAGTRGAITGYEKIDKLLKMPPIKRGKATLSQVDGKIENVEKSPTRTGLTVWVNKTKHYVPQDLVNQHKIRVGTIIKSGDALSDGLIQPDELLRHKGMLPAQEYIVDQLQEAYKSQDIPLRRRAVETVIRSVTNTTRVLDPGSSEYLPGDVAPYTVVEDFNHKSLGQKPVHESDGHALLEDVPGLRRGVIINAEVKKTLERLGKTKVEVGPVPIAHEPFLKGVKQIPLLREDWMSQLGYQHLAQAIIGGATKMKESDLHGYAPVPAFAFGAEFGDAPGGRSETEGVY